ncbi:MAG: XRE family transcriptional regulator [Bdellovibrionota bacterium]
MNARYWQNHGKKKYIPNGFGEDEVLKQIKRQACQAIARAAHRGNWSQKDLSRYIGTSQACISRVFNQRVEELSMTQLFNYLVILEPRVKILISV